MRIDIDEFVALYDRILEIERVDLEDVEFFKNGKPLDIPLDTIRDFELTGLNNRDFILTNYWRKRCRGARQ